MGLYRRKDSQYYWMTFKVNREKVFESTGTTNKKLANRIFAKRTIEIAEGKWFGNQDKRRPIKDMIERFQSEYTDHKDYYQKARDKSCFKHLIEFFGEHAALEEIDLKVGEYELHRKTQITNRGNPPSPATVLKELALLRRMFNVARKQWKWRIDNPVLDIELPKVNNERVRYLSQEEYQSFFEVLDTFEKEWVMPIVIIALETGLRLSNLCQLLWSEVDMTKRMISLNAEKMKNHDHIGIPLTERAQNILKELQKVTSLSGHVFHDNGRKLYDRKVQRAVREVLRRANIGDFHFHDLRHTFASYLRQQGVDIHTISKLLGHRNARTSQRYAHLSVENLRDAVSVLKAKTGYVLVTFEDDQKKVSAINP